MHLKVFIFVTLICMLQTCEVQSHEFLKSAYNKVKSTVSNAVHKVTHLFGKHDHTEDCEYSDEGKNSSLEEEDVSFEEEDSSLEVEEQDVTTTLQPVIDVRFKSTKSEENDEPTDSSTDVPDLNSRFFISAPCGEGTRKSGGGCRQVIH